MDYLYQEIEVMRHRPAMYLGRISLTALYDYLGGFQHAMYGLSKDGIKKLIPLPFIFFNDYVANYYNWYEATTGWKNIILREMNNDDEKGLWTFYELFDSFKALSIQSCVFAILNKESINYHYTDEFAPKCSQPPDYEKREPLYINPNVVYMIELTCNAGYLCLVETDSQHRLEHKIYKRKEEIEAFVKQCFGLALEWKCTEIKNIEFHKEFQY